MNYLERKKMQFTLYKVREILIQEGRKGYYRNAMNVREIMDLDQGIYINDVGVEYHTEQKMQVYHNGYCEFFTFMYPKRHVKTLIKK